MLHVVCEPVHEGDGVVVELSAAKLLGSLVLLLSVTGEVVDERPKLGLLRHDVEERLGPSLYSPAKLLEQLPAKGVWWLA